MYPVYFPGLQLEHAMDNIDVGAETVQRDKEAVLRAGRYNPTILVQNTAEIRCRTEPIHCFTGVQRSRALPEGHQENETGTNKSLHEKNPSKYAVQ
jgi:hypothetical protein